MTTAATAAQQTSAEYDPDSYRMSLGDHLEELRWRLIFSLLGLLVAAIVCFIYGEEVMAIFCKPLVNSLRKYDLNPQIYMTAITDSFVVYMQVSLICAAVLAGPWIIYQLWQFVRSGLYPKERKYITRYMPLSIGLLITGMLFLYYFVLPITLNFLVQFTISIPLKGAVAPVDSATVYDKPAVVQVYHGNPPHPVENQMWMDDVQKRVKIYFHNEIRVMQFGPQNLMAPMITLPEYISLVEQLLLAFGLAFQLPLVMLAIVRIGILTVPQLRKWRRIAYFIICCISAVVVPDVVTGMAAMMVPLIALYELGIILADRSVRHAEAERAAEDAVEGDSDSFL